MIIRIDAESPVPTFEQIRRQIAAMASSSVIATGTRLPTIRQLARDLNAAPGTVARAYQELERSGVIVTRGRHGTFVSDAATAAASRTELEQAAETLAVHGYQLGMNAEQVADLIRRAFRTVTAST